MNRITLKNSTFYKSIQELKSTVNISISAMLLALRVLCAIFTVLVIPEVKIGFSFLPTSIAATLFGPFVSALVDGFGDILGYVFNPVGGAYFPGFTVSAIITGLIYGFFFYKKKMTFKRIILCEIVIAVAVEFLLSSLWVSILYSKAIYLVMSTRVIKILVMLPIRVILNFSVGKILSQIKVLKK